MHQQRRALLRRKHTILENLDAPNNQKVCAMWVSSFGTLRLLPIWNGMGKGHSCLSVGSRDFHTGSSIRCEVTWEDGVSYWSKSGKPHTTFSGFVGNATKGQYKTNRACPYPEEFCTYVAGLIAKLAVHFNSRMKRREIRREHIYGDDCRSSGVNASTTR